MKFSTLTGTEACNGTQSSLQVSPNPCDLRQWLVHLHLRDGPCCPPPPPPPQAIAEENGGGGIHCAQGIPRPVDHRWGPCGAGHVGLTHTETQRGGLWTA